MIYIKGLFAGTVTLIVTVVAYIAGLMWWLSRTMAAPPPNGGEVDFDLRTVGFDLSSLLHSPLFWLVAVVGFGIGFSWAVSRSVA